MSKSASSGWSVPGIARDWDVDDLVNVLTCEIFTVFYTACDHSVDELQQWKL